MKKILICTFLLNSFVSNAQLGTWTQKGNLPITFGLSEAAAFQIGAFGYLAAGWDGSTEQNTLWQYDPSGDTWMQKANFIGSARVSPVGFAINGKGYVGTGRNQSNCFTDFYEYDPAGNSWTAKANCGGVGRTRAVGFVIDSLGYIGTGADNNINPLSDFWAYSPTTDSWTQKASVPSAKREANAFSVNGKGYIGSGLPTQNSFYEYDPVTDTWTQKANFPNLVSSGGWGFSMNTFGYVYYWVNSAYNFYQYDPSTNTWAYKATFPGSGRYYARGFVWGQNAYLGTGGQPATYYIDWYEYNTGVLDVGENKTENQFQISPNPINSGMNLQLHFGEVNSPTTFEIFSVNGELLFSKQIQSGENSIVIPGHLLNSGMYLVRMSNENSSGTEKLVVE